MAYLASGGGANWATGITGDDAGGSFTVESRFEFAGTVAPTDLNRATDAREKGRSGITGTAYAYAGASGRVTSEALGRDLNPLGRGDGRAYVAGGLNLGQLYPALPKSLAQPGTGNSVNNGCAPEQTDIWRQAASQEVAPNTGSDNVIEGHDNPNCHSCCTLWKEMMCEYQKQFDSEGNPIGPGIGWWGIPAVCMGCWCECASAKFKVCLVEFSSWKKERWSNTCYMLRQIFSPILGECQPHMYIFQCEYYKYVRERTLLEVHECESQEECQQWCIDNKRDYSNDSGAGCMGSWYRTTTKKTCDPAPSLGYMIPITDPSYQMGCDLPPLFPCKSLDCYFNCAPHMGITNSQLEVCN